MEANCLDLSTFNIVLRKRETELAKNNIEKSNQGKKIIGITIPKDLPTIVYDFVETELPLYVRFDDGREEKIFFPYDTYFRLLNIIWNHPDYAKDATRITMEKRMEDAAPYNVFFNTLRHCPETKEQLYSISFTDLLCPSFGKLKCSLHFNSIANIKWILAQYALRKLHKLPMTIIQGKDRFAWPEKETMEQLYPNIDYHYIDVRKKETDIGYHDSKLSIFVYEDDSLRVVIGLGNRHIEWEVFNQQIWISPACPKLPQESCSTDGESPTGFKSALLDYFFTYEQYNISSMQEWIDRIKNADFRDVKVVLLFSVPGVHYPRKNGSILHYLGHLLSLDCTIPAPKEEHDSWRIIAQTASLGLLGQDSEEYLTTYLLKCLGSNKESPYLPTLHAVSKAKFSLIFPTVQNAISAHVGPISAFCCVYEKRFKEAQRWLLRYKCLWKTDRTNRTRALSYSKSYCRISPCWQKMAYYFLTTENLSRSGWGKIPNRDSGVYIRSQQMGVLFLPKYFGEEYFEVKDSPNRKNKKLFPMMFDLPLTPYGPNDDPFCYEELVEQGTIQGHVSFIMEQLNDIDNNNTASHGAKTVKDFHHEITTALTKNNDVVLSPRKTGNKTEGAGRSNENAASINVSTGETRTRDMKFNIKPNTNVFFPSFNKKS